MCPFIPSSIEKLKKNPPIKRASNAIFWSIVSRIEDTCKIRWVVLSLPSFQEIRMSLPSSNLNARHARIDPNIKDDAFLMRCCRVQANFDPRIHAIWMEFGLKIDPRMDTVNQPLDLYVSALWWLNYYLKYVVCFNVVSYVLRDQISKESINFFHVI